MPSLRTMKLARMQTPARNGPDGRSVGARDGRTSQAPAVDHGQSDRQDQADLSPAVGVGPVRVQTGWPSPADFWP